MSAELFEAQRPRLLAIAYGMLGSVMEAEDVVQDAWLRWQRADVPSVESPAAWLTTVVTRIAVDRLRAAKRRRETYVGPWLPEPLVTEEGQDAAEKVAEAEALSLALLTALERLNPLERAVFLLREVFDFDYSEIADVLDRSPAACRQIAHRARERVGDPRRAHRPDPQRESEIVAAFQAALAFGDVEELRRVLVEDAVLWSDGGGAARAARHPIVGAERIARFLVRVARTPPPEVQVRLVRANRDPALLILTPSGAMAVMALELTEEGVAAIRTVLNPVKLQALIR
jgi:RNA polymerase sigma-70 factor (ECF subfamily)